MATKDSDMESFVFASSDDLETKDFNSLVTFADKFEEFFEVVLSGENELKILFSLLGMNLPEETALSESEDFIRFFDCSAFNFPELSAEEFDEFYEAWLEKTGRESDMDEYGQLIFIQGQAIKWNKNNKKFVLHAKP